VLYCVVYFVPSALAKQVQSFREEYDPTARLIEPHLTIVLPSAGLSKELVTRHVERVLRNWSLFTVQFTGLGKSWDHWLFLLVGKGNKDVVKLHDHLYAGVLAPQQRKGLEFIPHVGLGHFGTIGEPYDVTNPTAGTLDQQRYQRAITEASALKLDFEATVSALHLIGVDESVTKVEKLTRFALK
jgi:2'-5' RNA ligase superfamily protein